MPHRRSNNELQNIQIKLSKPSANQFFNWTNRLYFLYVGIFCKNVSTFHGTKSIKEKCSVCCLIKCRIEDQITSFKISRSNCPNRQQISFSIGRIDCFFCMSEFSVKTYLLFMVRNQ